MTHVALTVVLFSIAFWLGTIVFEELNKRRK
jgi:hypothetical protein